MQRIQRAQRFVGGQERRQVADCGTQLPELAAPPKGIELAPGVGQPALGDTALAADPEQSAGGLHQRQA